MKNKSLHRGVLEGHTKNVTCLASHPVNKNIVASGSEDT
jgi:hypothetical protein